MNFFFDNMLSPKLARMFAALYDGTHNMRHVRHDSRFADNTADTIWLTALIEEKAKWNVISGDMRIFDNPAIIAEMHESDIMFFCSR